jgi:hypothetical protein
VFTTIYNGEIFWIWGDTNKPGFPLGNFHASGATSQLPSAGGLDPDVGVDLTYFENSAGFSKPMAPPATVPGDGVTWLSGLTVLPDAAGDDVLFAYYGKYLQDFTNTEVGLIRFDPTQEVFVEEVEFAAGTGRPKGQSFEIPDDGYVYNDDSTADDDDAGAPGGEGCTCSEARGGHGLLGLLLLLPALGLRRRRLAR